MVRTLRYPRMFYSICVLTVVCALLRDVCVGASLDGAALALLVATVVLLILCLLLMSCRFFIDARGVGVGFLLRVHRTKWENIASLGIVSCNSRRRYFYGMYQSSADFLNMLHHAPRCGAWGFVVPISKRLLDAVQLYCPFDVDTSALPRQRREGRMHLQWHHTALYALTMLPAVVVAFATGTLMLLAAVKTVRTSAAVWMTLGALALFAAALMLLRKLGNTLLTCPGFSEQGVCTGAGLYLPWEDVHFGYVHRIGKISGMYLLSQPLDAIKGRGTPPVMCLSMPDTKTMLLAYLTYCPHASKGLEF